MLAHPSPSSALGRDVHRTPAFVAILLVTLIASALPLALPVILPVVRAIPIGTSLGLALSAGAVACGATWLARSYHGMERTARAWAAAEAAARTAALTDELTGLYNRRGFRALAEHQLRIARRSGGDVLLLYIDLDGFKQVNDHLGHDAGDRALREVAAILRHTIRETDVVARLGGDEFAVLVVDADESTEDAVRARLARATAARNALPDRESAVAYTIGRASLDDDRAAELDDLLATADRAMYVAKRGRPARVG